MLLVDEIDSLVGDTLLSVLRQMRAGYENRPASFPHSIVLCGVRDISMRGASPSRFPAEGSRDYRIRSSTGEMIAGDRQRRRRRRSLRNRRVFSNLERLQAATIAYSTDAKDRCVDCAQVR